MPPLRIEFEGLVVSLDLPADRVWEVLRYAHMGCQGPEKNNGVAPLQGPPPHYFPPPSPSDSKAGQIRNVAREVLADGRPHERREIAQAVREAGLEAANLDGALKGHFERAQNVMGRPTYRRLDWEQIHRSESNGHRENGIQVLGKLGDAG